MIYLDYSAHTPADPAVLDKFTSVERSFIGNANSAHRAGISAAEEMERITARIAELLKVSAEEIIYTSGASESNNLAIKGIARASRHIGRHILSTSLEHASVSAPLTALQEQGWEVELVPTGRDGQVDITELRTMLRRETVLVAVCAVDSELGTPQPVQKIASLLKDYPDCRLHVDATQAVGKMPLTLEVADSFSIAPHKFYGLNGSGLLIKRRDLIIEPLIHGGSSTTIYRSGTPTLALNASIAEALGLALENQEERTAIVRRHNERLRRELTNYPAVRINSPESAVPHILNLSVKGVRGTVFQKALSDRGVCVSVKSACSTDALPSRAVFAVSRDRKNALSSWRISLSHLTTEAEIDEFLQIFDLCYKELL